MIVVVNVVVIVVVILCYCLRVNKFYLVGVVIYDDDRRD